MNGIMFTSFMTLANLGGRKSRTSRCKGLDKINMCPNRWEHFGFDESGRFSFRFKGGDQIINIRCPYGGIGSELYGKETYWQYGWWDNTFGSHMFVPIHSKPIYYCNTLPKDVEVLKGFTSHEGYYKRSAMMMPETASRYHIILNGIGCQRIQSISHKDITAEGLGDGYTDIGWNYAFGQLWNSINGKTHPWSRNDWVFYYYYEVKKKE